MLCFFSMSNGDGELFSTDADCTNLQAARRHALLYIAKVEDGTSTPDWTGGEIRGEVRDERGKLLTTVIILAVDAQLNDGERDDPLSAGSKAEAAFVLGPGHAWRRRNDRNT